MPSGDSRSSVTLFLLRLNAAKKPAPALDEVARGVALPSGSTLITSAPRSASTSPQAGPITMWENSTTRMPSRGSGDFMRSPAAARRKVFGSPASGTCP